MKVSWLGFAALAATLPAGLATGAVVKYKEWPASAAGQILASEADRKAFEALPSDEEAEKFLSVFWAKRDPDLKTPKNEAKEKFDSAVAEADQLFAMKSKRGALTERGRAFILIGRPRQMSKSGAASDDTVNQQVTSVGGQTAAALDTAVVPGAQSAGGGAMSTYKFRWEREELPPNSEVKTLEVKFTVDRFLTKENVANDLGTLRRLEDKAVAAMIVNPNLTFETLPRFTSTGEPAPDEKAVAEAAKGPALAPAVREALEKALSGEADSRVMQHVIAYRDGATRLMLQAGVPEASAASPLRWVVLVKEGGVDVARREEAASVTKHGKDAATAITVALAPGSYDVAAALTPEGGAPIVTTRQAVVVAPLPTDFAVSRLVVASGDDDAPGSKVGDPFVFSTRRFHTKPGGLAKSDGLSWAIRVYNPTVDAAGKIFLKRSIRVRPKGGSAMDVPLPPDQPVAAPPESERPVVLDLAGAVVDQDLGQYFPPGEYEMTLTLQDANAPAGAKPLVAKAPFKVNP